MIAVDDLIAQGVKVVAQISYRAKVGGKEARWTGTAVMEIEEGKIVKSWVNSGLPLRAHPVRPAPGRRQGAPPDSLNV